WSPSPTSSLGNSIAYRQPSALCPARRPGRRGVEQVAAASQLTQAGLMSKSSLETPATMLLIGRVITAGFGTQLSIELGGIRSSLGEKFSLLTAATAMRYNPTVYLPRSE
ncbi:MAG: hypothetical protein LQ347_006649, partial [Umbilicaria vellea]